MLTVDERLVAADPETCFRVAADVERWPDILPHYRWVRFHHRDGDRGRVEMAAWRPFPLGVRYPTWWVSDMRLDRGAPAVLYTHIDGITRGMDVRWEFTRREGGTHVRIVHEWPGPDWPLIGPAAASLVIGPHFVSAIAQRTLAGVAIEAERSARRQHMES